MLLIRVKSLQNYYFLTVKTILIQFLSRLFRYDHHGWGRMQKTLGNYSFPPNIRNKIWDHLNIPPDLHDVGIETFFNKDGSEVQTALIKVSDINNLI